MNKVVLRKLKAYRQLKNIKQEELANILGVGTNTYSFKENGKSEFTLSEAKTISQFLGITMDELFSDDVDHKVNTKLSS